MEKDVRATHKDNTEIPTVTLKKMWKNTVDTDTTGGSRNTYAAIVIILKNKKIYAQTHKY